MADLNAQSSEYGPMRGQLKTLHDTQLKNINDAFTKIKGVAAVNGGFQADATSKKVNQLLDAISNEILPAMAVVFSQSESSMDNFVKKVKNLDQEIK